MQVSKLYCIKVRRNGSTKWVTLKDAQDRPLLWGNSRAAWAATMDLFTNDVIGISVAEYPTN